MSVAGCGKCADSVSDDVAALNFDRWDEHPEISEPCIILQGTLHDGFEAIGPFNGFDSAADYAEHLVTSTWIMTLMEPALYE